MIDRYTLRLLAQYGASDDFIRVLLEATEGSVVRLAESVRQHHDEGSPDAARERVEMAGGFASKLWNGETFDAFLTADANHAEAMCRAFDQDELYVRGVEREDFQPGYTETMLDDKYGRYAEAAP